MIKKILLTMLIIISLTLPCYAYSSLSIDANEGYESTNGWVEADMSIENGIVSTDGAYSMKMFKDFGLIPVAYCSSGGSHLGTYYTFYVNPYNDCLIIGRMAQPAPHREVFTCPYLESFSLSGQIVHYLDLSKHQDLYRKAIDVAKTEFYKYQATVKQ